MSTAPISLGSIVEDNITWHREDVDQAVFVVFDCLIITVNKDTRDWSQTYTPNDNAVAFARNLFETYPSDSVWVVRNNRQAPITLQSLLGSLFKNAPANWAVFTEETQSAGRIGMIIDQEAMYGHEVPSKTPQPGERLRQAMFEWIWNEGGALEVQDQKLYDVGTLDRAAMERGWELLQSLYPDVAGQFLNGHYAPSDADIWLQLAVMGENRYPQNQ